MTAANVCGQALAKLIVVGYRREDVYLHCAPLYHIGGMSSMLAVLAAGGTQVCALPINAQLALRCE